ncbi:hypothetical protein [Polynucleobacter sphagniphilus]|uniref:hypothetical protein n=1 Tax=Polynucleobacter sphagniphilus TaxID=1743169 RepID=UPI00096BA742|nr:hypothetical protein [Polynucleobacter sphagniphilus]MDH6524840.1 beta-1,4-mannosyl-glycoprotein beta-1,4-N-acetylglucosaminyltransferase [Polynucleobacter sphagniphilus]OLY95976.1 hypothetical protein BOQ04_06865 [Polynucleobacter sphagniphilus]
MKPRIYDCFIFYNESRLLKLRLETLWEEVDLFVICESKYTFSGNPKPINFKMEDFKDFESKIRYLLIDHYPFETDDPWRREEYQRNYLLQGLLDARDSDWVMISDVDEIIHPQAIALFNPKRYLRASLIQKCYSYYLNNLHVGIDGSISQWNKPKITTYRALRNFFKTPENLREYKATGIFRSFLRTYINKLATQKIMNGGWHFTWMGSVNDMISKLESFSHQEFNTEKFKNPSEMLKKINSGGDLLDRGFIYQAQDISSEFPSSIVKNYEEYKDWILPFGPDGS